jgi:hypothetical protein
MANLVRRTHRLVLTAFSFGCLFSGSNLFSQVPCKPAPGMFARAGKLVRMDRSELVLTVGTDPQKQQPKQSQQQVVFAIGSCARVDAISPGETINVAYAKDSNRNTAFRIQRSLDIQDGSKAESLGVAELVLPPALTNEILDAVGLGTNSDDNATHRLSRNFAENRAAGVVTHVSVLSPFETELDVTAQNQASKAPPLRFRLSLITQVKGILRTGVPVAVYYEEGRSPYTATRVIVNPQ